MYIYYYLNKNHPIMEGNKKGKDRNYFQPKITHTPDASVSRRIRSQQGL